MGGWTTCTSAPIQSGDILQLKHSGCIYSRKSANVTNQRFCSPESWLINIYWPLTEWVRWYDKCSHCWEIIVLAKNQSIIESQEEQHPHPFTKSKYMWFPHEISLKKTILIAKKKVESYQFLQLWKVSPQDLLFDVSHNQHLLDKWLRKILLIFFTLFLDVC